MRWLLAVGLLVGCKNVETHDGTDAAVAADASPDARGFSDDFVINSTFAGNQFLSNDFEANGFQLAAINDSMWLSVFRDDCTDCDLFGRRFDAEGVPTATTFADANQFTINLTGTTTSSIPAVATAELITIPQTTEYVSLVVWDFVDTASSMQGIACRGFHQDGAATSSQVIIANEPADVVSVADAHNGNFIVTWQSFVTTTSVIKSIIVRRDCMPSFGVSPLVISEATGSFGARRAHAASNGVVSLYTWIVDGDLHVRVGSLVGMQSGQDSLLIPKTATHDIDHVRVAAWGSSFVVAVRWAATSGTGFGKIELYRVSGNGSLMGGPYLLTERSGSDFASDKSFGIASRPDGLVLVAWHACETGPGSCDVVGRLVDASGTTIGPELVLPTTTTGDQTNPSVTVVGDVFVAAWNDLSAAPPDQSGGAVRGRIIPPELFSR